ncbi:MAG: hypothetical protein ABFR82_16795, partial [Nitrospirota bacterium]
GVGERTATWDGRNGSGQIVPAGTYTMQITASGSGGTTESQTHTVEVIKIGITSQSRMEVCPGCTVQFTGIIEPVDRTLVWSILNDGSAGASINQNGLLTAGSREGSIEVRITDSLLQNMHDESSVTVWQAHGLRNPETGRTVAEDLWINDNLWCAAKNYNIQQEADNIQGTIFVDDPNDLEDNSRGNAFRHAWINCMVSQRCSQEQAVGLWNAHEAIDGNPCGNATMDLWNNSVGRAVSAEGECTEVVLNALEDGRLRWFENINDPDTCTTWINQQ